MEFGKVIKDIVDRYPDADVAPLAASWQKGLNEGRKLRSSGSNVRGMLWDIRLSAGDQDDVASDGPGVIEFTVAPDDPYYLVMLFPADELSSNRLLYEVARHNFSTYMVRDFDLEVMNFGRLGLLIVKGFDNQADVNHYRSHLARDSSFAMPPEVRPVEISKSNFECLMNAGGSFDDYFRFMGEESIRNTHESVLPDGSYPSASEMYPSPDKESSGQGNAGDPEVK